MNEIQNPYALIQAIVDVQSSLIVIIEDEKPILMNLAFRKFFGVSSFEQYQKDFGSFINNFVPHPSYFHSGKVKEAETWIESLSLLSNEDKIVSMLSINHDPRAFSVHLDSSHESYTVLSLEDISANLIKRIMTDNEMNLDKASGAFTKEYFLHTSELLQDAASYNEKEIGITMIHLFDEENLVSSVAEIKKVIRQTDILVKWSYTTIVLAYMVDNKDNALLLTKKVQALLKHGSSGAIVSLVNKKNKIHGSINTMHSHLDELNENEIKML
ncbi:hypothetical protein JHD50_00875 [Sulfurimonas sp. MAG313]|nr:hypothetical protein [Sulfurimonas sp. MAG313]MDF1879864.1 hypothetical protein [Sulfurimonas sp. MAG313]